mmetsp:Transcript_1313/g.3299  ORF Transcript_1313/g.3299 Transcript_1313/m.3299 type:complete len:230 (-) Transcript_1313:234-923(-)
MYPLGGRLTFDPSSFFSSSPAALVTPFSLPSPISAAATSLAFFFDEDGAFSTLSSAGFSFLLFLFGEFFGEDDFLGDDVLATSGAVTACSSEEEPSFFSSDGLFDEPASSFFFLTAESSFADDFLGGVAFFFSPSPSSLAIFCFLLFVDDFSLDLCFLFFFFSRCSPDPGALGVGVSFLTLRDAATADSDETPTSVASTFPPSLALSNENLSTTPLNCSCSLTDKICVL